MFQQKDTALIGLIVMGASASIEKAFHKNVPDRVQITTTRVPFGEVSYNGFLEVTTFQFVQLDAVAGQPFDGCAAGCHSHNESDWRMHQGERDHQHAAADYRGPGLNAGL